MKRESNTKNENYQSQIKFQYNKHKEMTPNTCVSKHGRCPIAIKWAGILLHDVGNGGFRQRTDVEHSGDKRPM